MTPFQQDLFFLVVTALPMLWVLRRMGLPLWWAGLFLISLVLPFLGHMLLACVLALKSWPKLPMPEKPKRRSA
jgi:hypothetical protein